MRRALIDTASIHSALNEVHQGWNNSLSVWHRHSLLEMTFLLLQHNMRIIPRIGRTPKKVSKQTNDLRKFLMTIPDVMPRAKTHITSRKQAIIETVNWLDTNGVFLSQAWQKANLDNDFRNWVLTQREFRMVQHSEMHGQLFEEHFISNIASTLNIAETQIQEIYKVSTNPQKVKEIIQGSLHSDLELLTTCWVMGGMIRGKYYEKLSKIEDLQLALHPFRRPIEDELEVVHTANINQTQEIFVKLLIGCAFAQDVPYRITALGSNINLARKRLFAKNKDERILLEEMSTPDKSEEAAFNAARKIGIIGGSPEERKIIQTVLAWGIPSLISLGLLTWSPDAAAGGAGLYKAGDFLLKERTKKSVSDLITDKIYSSNLQFKLLSKSVAGRIDTKIKAK